MKALISPNENNRICQVEAQDFPVAEPLFWLDCADTITTEWTYDGVTFVAPVIPEPVVVVEPTKNELLAELELLTAKINALGN
jgi:hypothetical protein